LTVPLQVELEVEVNAVVAGDETEAPDDLEDATVTVERVEAGAAMLTLVAGAAVTVM
jgi:hypothetical protein